MGPPSGRVDGVSPRRDHGLVLEQWTHAVLRARLVVLLAWGVVLIAGIVASTQLPSLLTNSFDVPGTGSSRAAKLLAAHFGEQPEGTFLVVFPVRHPSDVALQHRLFRRLAAAARTVPGGHALPLRPGGGLLYGEVATRLDFQYAKRQTDVLRRALRTSAGPKALVTGQPAIQRDLDPILAADLRRGELIAVPFALVVLLALFGVSLAVAIPFLVAACTIAGTLAAVYAIAHAVPTTSFVTNLVTLIGLGLAVDYSLLIVHRFRDELRGGSTSADAAARTMRTAGRAIVVSGTTVAIALGMLALVRVPFIRSFGLGGVLVPLVSIAAALTLQPVLLGLLGARSAWTWSGLGQGRFWRRLPPWIVRRRTTVLAAATALLLALAAPLVVLRLVPASFAGIPASPESARALALLRVGAGPGVVTPTQVVIDAGAAGRARERPVQRAAARLAADLVRDSEPLVVASGSRSPYVDPTGRYARLVVLGRHEYGSSQERAFVRRLRDRLLSDARFPAGTSAEVGGAPAQGVDFLATAYSAFPWLVLAVLVVTYLALVRAFRSVVLPLTAVIANLLPVAAAYGVLVLVFQWGVGAGFLGVERAGHIEGWVPVVLFATLFGLSMDYEVFLMTRVREVWQRRHDNDRAVELGLERTGRVITSAALIMAAAFAGFIAGRVPGLQQLGVGLTAAVLLDAGVVRAFLVPSLAALLGPRNWWRPGARESVT
jgi:RND superfamily putative drug exporter